MIIYVTIATLLFVLGWIIYCKVKKNNPNNPPENIVSKSGVSISEKAQINEHETRSINTKENAIEDNNETSIDEKINDTLTKENINKTNDFYKRTLAAVITTGENEYYKELLQDSRWISLRDSIKKRDYYICQNCYNTIKINHLEELKDMNLSINQEVMDCIITSFPKLKDMFKDDITEEEVNFDWKRSSYISRYGIYRYDIDSINFNLVNYASHLITYPPILTSLDPSEVLSGYIIYKDIDNDIAGHKFSTRCYYLKGNNTKGEIYIGYFYGTISPFNEKKYSAVLTLDEYSMVFPLTGILFKTDEPLEVHHLKYSKTGKPWDVSKNNLITLCHSCHMEANKLPIPIE